MNSTRIVLSCYLAFAAFSLIELVYGDKGLIAQEDLKRYETKLQGNLDRLEATYSQLQGRYEALFSDRAAVTLEARRLDYYEGRDVVLKIEGLSPWEASPVPAKVLSYSYDNEYLDNFFRAVWFLLALMFYVILHFAEKLLPLLKRPKRSSKA